MKRSIYLGAVVLGAVVVTGTVAQVYPVRWDDGAVGRGLETYGVAAMTVEGEVRTVTASGAPRLWGRGRPGTVRNTTLEGLCENGHIRFGLSTIMVDWGSAADACPAGTWVCTQEERGTKSCNTLRGDSDRDGADCSGDSLPYPASGHMGWLAGAHLPDSGQAAAEDARFSGGQPVCRSLPVWCCSN